MKGPPIALPNSSAVAVPPGRHMVLFYGEEAFPVAAVAAFLGEGLAAGEAAVCIATAEHGHAIACQLAAEGFDADALRQDGRLSFLDVDEALNRMTSAGVPEEGSFNAAVSATLDGVAPPPDGRGRFFGEMVGLMVRRGDFAGAFALERLWHRFLASRPGWRVCHAYPMQSFAHPSLAGPFCRLCDEHDEVVPVLSWLDRPDLPGRCMAVLQQQARALEAEISERQQAERKLEEAHARLAAILDSSLDAVVAIDEAQCVVLFNPAAEKMLGWPAAEAIGGPLERFIPERLRSAHAGYLRRFGESGVGQRMMGPLREVMALRANGEEFPVDAAISQAMVGGRKLYTVRLRDISGRREAEAEHQARLAAEAASRAKSEFLSKVSHELRTPLHAVLGYAQLLRHEPGLPDRLRHGLDTIQDSGRHLLALINDLLDLARIEAGRFDLYPEPMNLATFLGAVADTIRVRALEKGLRFVCASAVALPTAVRADERRLRQVLLNLLDNAVKFTERGDVSLDIQVLARDAASVRLRFEVRDTGIGFQAAEVEAIFQPFEQLGSPARRAAGAGLGLAISRQLVRLMGGDIEVDSQPDGGSRFWFDLSLALVEAAADEPAAAVAAPAVAETAAPLELPSADAMQVLHTLALVGNMDDIRSQAARLAAEDARLGPFAERLRDLATRYQSRAILELVEQHLPEKG